MKKALRLNTILKQTF